MGKCNLYRERYEEKRGWKALHYTDSMEASILMHFPNN